VLRVFRLTSCRRKSYGGVLPEPRAWEFEVSFACFHGARHGIAVTNGTAALEVAMAALGLSSGDEVMVPNFTFVVTASVVLLANALPVMAFALTPTASALN